MKKDKKVVCIILEGMENKILDKFFKQGYLKNLKRLMSNQGGKLTSCKVPYEGSAIQTAFTGYAPEEHGVYSYWNIHNYDYIPKIITSKELVKPSLWQMKEFASEKFAVINLFGTHEPYEINGYLLTYLFQQSLHACYPKDLIKELSQLGLGYGHDVSAFYRGEEREKFLGKVFKIEQLRINAALELLKRVDMLIVNFTLIDRLSHFYYQELTSDVFTSVKEMALFKGYELLDQAIERFMNVLSDQSELLLFSDIGFGPLNEFVSVNNYLEKNGFLKRLPNGKIDWEHTTAFESVQGSHGININLKGRYRDGMISEESYESVRSEVMDVLRNIINPRTGFLMFKEVVPHEEYYQGTYSSKAPDIMLEPMDYRYVPYGDEYWADHVHRHYQSGWHRKECFWSGTGNLIDGVHKDGTMLDILPTLFNLADKEAPKYMKGNSLIS